MSDVQDSDKSQADLFSRATGRIRPRTRELMSELQIPEEILDAIEQGRYEWDIGRMPAVGVGSEAAARQAAARQAARNDFAIEIRRTEATQNAHLPGGHRRVFSVAITSAVGLRLVRLHNFEATLEKRGTASSVLFKPGDEEEWADASYCGSWDILAFEYLRAAEILADARGRNEPHPTLALIWLCRHHFELLLKGVIHLGGELGAQNTLVPTHHRLTDLWKETEPTLIRWQADDEPTGEADEDRAHAQAVISELQKVDPESMATRYPVNKKNVRFERPAVVSNFSIPKFMEAVQRASRWLTGLLVHMEIDLHVRVRMGK